LADGLGDDVYVLGCGMPMLPAVGICHGNRVGHDLAMPRAHQELGHPLDEGWTGFAGVRAQARNVAARWAQAARWNDADPEVDMAWGSDGADPAGYSIEEARTIATMVAICGGPFLLADDLTALRDEERAVLECAELLDLLGDAPFRPVDLFEDADPVGVSQHAFAPISALPRVWQTTRGDHRVVAICHWDDGPVRVATPDGLVGASELWTESETGAELEVPAHGVRVLRG
jgi:alpha-galactosidase